jgi:hypothetical protein
MTSLFSFLKRRKQALQAPICEHCGVPMAIKTIAPLMFAPTTDEIVYRCRVCQTEKKRTVTRPD